MYIYIVKLSISLSKWQMMIDSSNKKDTLINSYLVCVNSFVHCPSGHKEINGPCSELCR